MTLASQQEWICWQALVGGMSRYVPKTKEMLQELRFAGFLTLESTLWPCALDILCPWTSGNNFHKEAPVSMISQWTDGLRDSDDHEIIVLSQVLASPLTVGFTELWNVFSSMSPFPWGLHRFYSFLCLLSWFLRFAFYLSPFTNSDPRIFTMFFCTSSMVRSWRIWSTWCEWWRLARTLRFQGRTMHLEKPEKSKDAQCMVSLV